MLVFLVLVLGLLKWNDLRYRKRVLPPGTTSGVLERLQSVLSRTQLHEELESKLLGALMAALLVLVVAMFGCCIFTALLKWNDLRYRRKGLPPGTMGWPLVGETIEFLKLGPEFTKRKRTRYGNLFKTHIFGSPTIVSMDPELNKYVLMNEAKGFVPGYPVSMLDILGKYNIAWVYGSAHKTIRGAMLAVVSPTMTRDKDQLLAKSDRFLRSYLSSWEGKTFEIQKKTEEMVLLSFINHIGIAESSTVEALKQEFFKLVVGSISMRIDLPGTIYRKGLQARKKMTNILKKVIEERQTSQSPQDNMLSVLMGMEDSRHKLNMEEIIDQLLTIMYSSYETVSTTSMMALKYLQDHPKALQELREEHLEIRKHKGPYDSISWNDYKSMIFTRGVILETQRLATVVNGLMRKATQDTELNGFVIPKGWRILLHTREPNYDPFHYPEPLTFNPWRWKDNSSLESHYYCMLFGGGNRLCPGKELGIAEISIFLHYFVTRYRWEEVGDSKIVNFPRVAAPNGLYMKISKYWGVCGN